MDFKFWMAIILCVISVVGAIFGFRWVSKEDLFSILLSDKLTVLYRLHWFNVVVGAMIPALLLNWEDNAWNMGLFVTLCLVQVFYWVAGIIFLIINDDNGTPYAGKGGGW